MKTCTTCSHFCMAKRGPICEYGIIENVEVLSEVVISFETDCDFYEEETKGGSS